MTLFHPASVLAGAGGAGKVGAGMPTVVFDGG